jgi:hypothetical protein
MVDITDYNCVHTLCRRSYICILVEDTTWRPSTIFNSLPSLLCIGWYYWVSYLCRYWCSKSAHYTRLCAQYSLINQLSLIWHKLELRTLQQARDMSVRVSNHPRARIRFRSTHMGYKVNTVVMEWRVWCFISPNIRLTYMLTMLNNVHYTNRKSVMG